MADGGPPEEIIGPLQDGETAEMDARRAGACPPKVAGGHDHAGPTAQDSVSEEFVDGLPEDMDYPDTGCRAWRTCLNCPLVRCIEDELPKRRGPSLDRREAIYQAWLAQEAKDLDALARQFGVTKRTVYRSVTGQGTTTV